MVLRPFVPSDLTAVQRLIWDTIDQCYPAAYSPRAVAYFKQFHSLDAILRRADDGVVLVADSDHGIVGTGALLDGEIAAVFVRPGTQRTGIGTALMDALERAAAEQGLDSVRLYVSLPSLDFYTQRGYRVFDEGALDVGEGEHLGYWQAAKTLSSGS